MPAPRAALAEIQASASPCTASCTALLCDSQLPEVQQHQRGSQHLTRNACAQSHASKHRKGETSSKWEHPFISCMAVHCASLKVGNLPAGPRPAPTRSMTEQQSKA